MIYRETVRRTQMNWPTMWSLRPLNLASFLVAERCCSITLDVHRNDNPIETCRIARSNRREFSIVTKYDPSSCGLNNFMELAFVIGLDALSSSSSSEWKNKFPTTSSMIVGLEMTNYKLSLSLSKKLWMPETSFSWRMQPSLDARAIDNWSNLRDVEIRDDFCRPRIRTGIRIVACSWCVGVSHRDLHASRARCGHRKGIAQS
jgi:hypothetical protein